MLDALDMRLWICGLPSPCAWFYASVTPLEFATLAVVSLRCWRFLTIGRALRARWLRIARLECVAFALNPSMRPCLVECGVMTASVLKAILGLRLSWSPLLVFLAPLDLQNLRTFASSMILYDAFYWSTYKRAFLVGRQDV